MRNELNTRGSIMKLKIKLRPLYEGCGAWEVPDVDIYELASECLRSGLTLEETERRLNLAMGRNWHWMEDSINQFKLSIESDETSNTSPEQPKE